MQTIALFFIPESPKYTFIFRENYGLALSDLSKLRGGDEEFANLELKIFEREKLVSSDSVSIKQLFTSRHFRWPLFLAVFLMAAQQVSLFFLLAASLIECLVEWYQCGCFLFDSDL